MISKLPVAIPAAVPNMGVIYRPSPERQEIIVIITKVCMVHVFQTTLLSSVMRYDCLKLFKRKTQYRTCMKMVSFIITSKRADKKNGECPD